ncbi:MAG: hypothetical protein AAGE01_09600 [Pseudomonadota bacterium]
MSEQKSVLKAFGGVKGLVLGSIALAGFLAYQSWNRGSSQSAMQQLGADLGLSYEQSGTRPKLNGRIDDVGVRIEVTTQGPGSSTSSSQFFTRFVLSPEGGPYGRIVGASLRQSIIGEFSDDERISSGDPAFDEAVFLYGEPGNILPHLNAAGRAAVLAAVDEDWNLDGYTWEWLEAGRINDSGKVRAILDIGLNAARATRVSGDTEAALAAIAESDPEAGVRSAAAGMLAGAPTPSMPAIASAPAATARVPDPPKDVESAIAALEDVGSPAAIEAAIYLAAQGDGRKEVQSELMMAVGNPEWEPRIIEALATLGGPGPLMMLRTVTGEHEAAAKAAIEAIEARE